MAIRRWIWAVMAGLVSPAIAGGADVPPPGGIGLGFRADGAGVFAFDTGLLQGRLKLDGRYQGLYPVVEKAGGRN